MRPYIVAVATCLLVSAPAHAQSEADQLFDQGLKDMVAGNYEAGCPAIADSHALEPLPGSAFTLAECYAKWGKSERALERYREFLLLYTALSVDERREQEERHAIAVDQIAALEAALPPKEPAQPQPQPVPKPTREPDAADSGWSGMHTAAVVAGGVGAVGLVIGIVAGAVMLSKRSDLEDNCDGTDCNATGIDAARGAKQAGNVSTVGWIVGLVGVGAGVTLWLLAPSLERGGDVAIVVGPAALQLKGSF